MKKKLLFFFIFFFIFFIFGIYLLSNDEHNKFSKYIKDNTPVSIKYILKKTIFFVPTLIREHKSLKKDYKKLANKNLILDLEKSKYKNKLNTGKFDKKILATKKNNYTLESYVLPFFNDENIYLNNKKGYLEQYKENIVVAFGSGKTILIDKNQLITDKIFSYKVVKNNILEKNLFDSNITWAGIKDAKIIEDKLYLSYTKQFPERCFSIGILVAQINYNYLNFEDFFDPKECVSFEKNKKYEPYRYFAGYQTGGRIVAFKDKIVLTVGDFNDWILPQDLNSIFGKILIIDKKTGEYNVLSLGHRNPQGLHNSLKSEFLISAEHGPKGGDEINLININEAPKNYGWPISSYGDHYPTVPINSFTKKYAPLHKNHKKFGFVEPIKVFYPSIGISEIIFNYFDEKKNSYFVTSLKQKTIYNINFNQQLNEEVKISEKINIKQRIRDIIYDPDYNLYYMYLENTPKLSILIRN